MLEYENKYHSNGYKMIAGMDEVGRGPLAGPVCVACVVMPLDSDSIIQGVNDSKKLSKKKRELLDLLIRKTAIDYSIQCVAPEVIDEINILNATKLAMNQAVKNLKTYPDIVLVDYIAKPDFDFKYETIIKGDALSYSIACASIIAKVYRDNLMCEYGKLYPQYGFEKHSGYGTKFHIDALQKYGLCPIHRKSFTTKFKVD